MTSKPSDALHLRDLARLRRVRDRIDRQYAQPLNVEALAHGVHMSGRHLSRQFKLAFGESPYSYLMTRRIERAMALLRRGDLSVTEVCFEVGCASLGTFSTRFTALVGVSPGVYRSDAAQATAGMPSCVARQVTRPIVSAGRQPRYYRRRAPHHRRDDGQGHVRDHVGGDEASRCGVRAHPGQRCRNRRRADRSTLWRS